MNLAKDANCCFNDAEFWFDSVTKERHILFFLLLLPMVTGLLVGKLETGFLHHERTHCPLQTKPWRAVTAKL